MRTTKYRDFTITALGHDGFLIERADPPLAFVFDPFEIKEPPEVNLDYLFITHSHYDHCDPSSVRRLIKPKTNIIAPPSCKAELEEFADQLTLYEGKEKKRDEKLTYWTIPAYNINKFRTPSEVFHPISLGGVGYLVEIGSVRFYHAGDTDKIPEMEQLKKIDAAFLPISGTFVMTLEEAMEAAKLIQPDLVIPMHFGKLLGSVSDANRFQNLLRGDVKVEVLSLESV